MQLEDVKCPSCGNEDEFEVSVLYRRNRIRLEIQDIPEAHVLTCVKCGVKTGYKAAQVAYQENWDQKREMSIVPVDVNIPAQIIGRIPLFIEDIHSMRRICYVN